MNFTHLEMFVAAMFLLCFVLLLVCNARIRAERATGENDVDAEIVMRHVREFARQMERKDIKMDYAQFTYICGRIIERVQEERGEDDAVESEAAE